MSKRILVVVDMQNDFITGSLGSLEAQAIVPKVRDKILNGGYDLVIATQDTHDVDYLQTLEGRYLPVEHCIEGTEGYEIHPDIESVLPRNALVLPKLSFGDYKLVLKIQDFILNDSLCEETLEDMLSYFSTAEIELVGLCTDICVVSNALFLRSAFKDTKVRVDASCCAGTTKENHEAALQVMRMCQIEVYND